MTMDTTTKFWVSVLPYGQTLEAIEEYADATLYDDNRGIAFFVNRRIDPEHPIKPFLVGITLQELRGYIPTLTIRDAYDAKAFYAVGVGDGVLSNTLQGGWVDNKQVYREDALLLADVATAMGLGNLFSQQSVLAIFPPKGTGDGTLYLMADTPANRGIALSVAGGYTADGEHLLVASTEPLPTEAIEGLVAFRPVRIELLNL